MCERVNRGCWMEFVSHLDVVPSCFEVTTLVDDTTASTPHTKPPSLFLERIHPAAVD